jgi:hypothetical protein
MRVVLAFVCGAALAAGVVLFIVNKKDATPQPASQAATVSTPVAAPAPVPAQAVEKRPSAWRAAKPKTPPPVEQLPVETAQNTPPPPAAAVAPEPAPAPPTTSQPVEQALPPPPPPQPRSVMLTAGTLLPVRLTEVLSSDRSQAGDSFSATLDHPLIVDGLVVAERGSRVEGKVVTSEKAGRVKGVSELALQLVRLNTSDGQRVDLRTETWSKAGPTSRNEDAAKIGGGAALGAIIGAIAGGGKGAAIGAGAGGAAGVGGTLATRGKPVVLAAETRISFRLRDPVTLTEKLR